MTEYYDGTKLLSLKDINGNRPEIYMCTTNRSAGKTTYFARLCCNKFFKNGEKFAILYRFNYELDGCADKFYKDVSSIFFPGTYMTSQKKARGTYHELFIDNKSCGYALSINSADAIRKYSHFFSDVSRIMFDEFQPESSTYCPKELDKFQSIHVSIARGGGKQSRYVPVYMCGNTVTILNPYYTAMGIASRLNDSTKFLRGEGFVLEQGFVQSAADAQSESAFNRAFKNSRYMQYANQNVYLNDSKSFIEKPEGQSRYVVTLRYKGEDFSIRQYPSKGIVYCDDKADSSFPTKIAVTTDDHEINYVMLRNNDNFLVMMRYFFEKGCFRFKDLRCKEAVLNALSY